MTDVRDGGLPENDASAAAKAEAQRRIQEIMAQGDAEEDDSRSRRTRAILIAILILLLLIVCAIGAFLYRMLSPGLGGDSSELNGITWIRSIYGYGPAESQQFINPNDVTTAPDGLIWVADPGTHQIVAFRGDGTYVDRIAGNKNTGEPFRVASRIAVDPDGIMYIVDRANESLTILDGQQKLVSAKIPGASSVDVNDQMVVVGSNSGFAILDKDGNVKTIVGTRGPGDDQFDTVGGVAIDGVKQSIYVVDTYNNRMSAWDFAGKRKWIVTLGNPANEVKLEGGKSLPTTSTAPSRLQLPTDVTIDGKGRPVVLDAFDFSIAIFEPDDGTFVEKWGNYGEQDGQFMYPTGLNYDASKDWFVVADTDNQRAQIIRIAGTGPAGPLGLLSGLNRLLSGPARALWPCLALLPLLLLILFIRRWLRRRAERAAEEEMGGDEGPAEPVVET